MKSVQCVAIFLIVISFYEVASAQTSLNWTMAIAWSTDSDKIAIADYEGVWLYKNSGEFLTTILLEKPLALSWHPQNDTLAIALTEATGSYIQVWDTENLSLQHKFKVGRSESTIPLAWSPNGEEIATQNDTNYNVVIRKLETPREIITLSGHSMHINVLAWHPNGSLLASGGWDNKVYIWDVATQEIELEVLLEYPVFSLAWNMDGTQIAIGSGHTETVIIDVFNGGTITKLAGQEMGTSAIFWNNRGLFTLDFTNILRLWDIDSWEIIGTLNYSSQDVISVDPTGNYVVISATGSELELVDLESSLPKN